MYTTKERTLTDLEKLEDKFDDIIEELSQKIIELEYETERQESFIGDINYELQDALSRVDDLESTVELLEEQLDKLEE